MSSEVQLSGNEMLNKKVLSWRRKVRSDDAVRGDTGRVFHARAAATGKTASRCVGADLDLIMNAERFARIDLDRSVFEKERNQ